MANVTVSATFCNANQGEHARVTLEVNGTPYGPYEMTWEDVTSVPDEQSKEDFVRNFIRLHALGKTPATVRSNLVAGRSVVI